MMDYAALLNRIWPHCEAGDLCSLTDAFTVCQEWEKQDAVTVLGRIGQPDEVILDDENRKAAHAASARVRSAVASILRAGDAPEGTMDLYYRTMLFDAPYDFDVYLRTIEFKQAKEKQFYAPRRRYLLPVVRAYQEVLDGKLRLLTVSLVKRAGKSQLGINFVNMLSGRYPNRSTLMEGTGDALVDSFYKGCLEYLQGDDEYTFREIFPDAVLVQTNADTKVINLVRKSRFPTIMCRSVDARQVGLSEATNVLYLDDCVEGREEAKNRARLDDKWEVISGDVIGRAVEGTPIVISGTRYSMYDPIGRLIEEAQKQNWAYKSVEIPALDPVTDESNYEYVNPKIGKTVFTTEFFREQREMLSEEQFASEFQQQPFEAKGVLFPETALNRYFKLPVDQEPDGIIAVCDTAEGKGDSTMLPIAYIYGEDVFIEDCVFSNSTPEFTKPECAKKLVQHNVKAATFESNAAGKYYCRDVEEMVRAMGGRCSFRTKYTTTNKRTRIELASDYILKHFYFKDKSLYAPADEYGQMMRELCNYTRTGKVAHDDAPDGMSLLENELRNLVGTKVEIMKRPF